MTRTVHLLRHAMPELRPGVPPEAWPLSAEGEAAAAAFRGRLPGGVPVLSSDEPKAARTALLACGVEPLRERGFGEVVRPREPFGDEVRERRAAWVRGALDERHAGWETPAAAAARFAATLARHEGEVVVATHGMVLTAWLVSVGYVAPGEPAEEFWAALAFPDVVTVDA